MFVMVEQEFCDCFSTLFPGTPVGTVPPLGQFSVNSECPPFAWRCDKTVYRDSVNFDCLARVYGLVHRTRG